MTKKRRTIGSYVGLVFAVQAAVFGGLTVFAGIDDYATEMSRAAGLAPAAAAAAAAQARDGLREVFALGAGSIIVILAVGLAINRRITRPVRRLAQAVSAATDGDLTARVPAEGPKELADLSERFNTLLEVRANAEDTLLTAYETERRASDRLRELDAMKTSFLLAISHELRTPLTAVVGYASMLEDEEMPLTEDERRDSTRRLNTQAKRLQLLLTDLLDVERMSRGTIEAHRREVDMCDLVVRVVENVGRPDLSILVPRGIRACVDPSLMERVLENLVVNAIKHTPSGTDVWIRAAQQDGEVMLIVEDSGPGVPDEIKESIFEAFSQGEVPEHAPGTGIGLALVKQFAKLHGGSAWVQDRLGGGSSFRVSVPSAEAAADEQIVA